MNSSDVLLKIAINTNILLQLSHGHFLKIGCLLQSFRQNDLGQNLLIYMHDVDMLF